MMKSRQTRRSRNSTSDEKVLFRYAGLGTQMLAGLGVAVFLGLKADEWMKLSFPLLTWLAPLLLLGVIFYRIYKDTSKK